MGEINPPSDLYFPTISAILAYGNCAVQCLSGVKIQSSPFASAKQRLHPPKAYPFYRLVPPSNKQPIQTSVAFLWLLDNYCILMHSDISGFLSVKSNVSAATFLTLKLWRLISCIFLLWWWRSEGRWRSAPWAEIPFII